MKNVIRDLYTEDTHDIYKVSTGVKTLWLIHSGEQYTYLSQWLGKNCLQQLFDISKSIDVYMYDDSQMFLDGYYYKLHGEFTDFTNGKVVKVGIQSTLEYLEKKGYV